MVVMQHPSRPMHNLQHMLAFIHRSTTSRRFRCSIVLIPKLNKVIHHTPVSLPPSDVPATAHNTAPYQSSSPTTSSSHHRYSRSGSNIQYFTGSNMSGSPASTSHEYYQGTHGVVGHTPGQPSADHLASVPRSGAFIPTPSEMMVPYPAYHSQQMGGAYNNRYPTQSHHMGMATNGLQGRTGAAPTHGAPANLPSPERYPCELCKGKTFSRSHDRKRHYETHHTAHPPVHLCRFCNKPFSR